MITLTLPLPPSANRMWRKAGRKIFKAPEYVEFCQFVGWECNDQKVKPLVGEVAATIKFYFARINGDADNRVKPTLDSLQGYAYENDAQVVRCCFERFVDKTQPRVEIELREIQR